MSTERTPTLLVIAGHDPSGLAGLTVDLETAAALGVRPLSLVSALTIQNSRRFESAVATAPATLEAAFDAIFEEIRFDAVKIGYLPNPEVIAAVGRLLDRLEGVPVVLDPVVAASADDRSPEDERLAALRWLLGRVTIATPNLTEAALLAGQAEADASTARRLHDAGLPNVVVTGADAGGDTVVHTLSLADLPPASIECERLPGRYRGSGCTFASAIAAGLARGRPLATAIDRAQAFTLASLKTATEVAPGIFRPRRSAAALSGEQ